MHMYVAALLPIVVLLVLVATTAGYLMPRWGIKILIINIVLYVASVVVAIVIAVTTIAPENYGKILVLSGMWVLETIIATIVFRVLPEYTYESLE
jgi:hypothetical protein